MKKPGAARRVCTVISAILVLAGAAVCACPALFNFLSRQQTDREAESFEQTVRAMRAKPQGSAESPLDRLLRKAEAYNKKIFQEGQKGLADPFSYEARSLDLAAFGIRDDLFGLLEIPAT